MKKFSGKIVALLMVLSLVIGGAAGSFVAYSLTRSNEQTTAPAVETGSAAADQETAKIKAIHDLIEKDYFQKVDSSKLYDGAIKGMISALGDPFSSYMNAKNATAFTESLSSSFQGIGAEVQMVGNRVSVVSPIKGSPAEKAGIRPNDQIVSIDGKTTEGLDINEAVSRIRGKKGTVVKLGIRRPGTDNELSFSIKRDDIPLRTVDSRMIRQSGSQIGYIAITQFNEKTDQEFADALTSLEKQKLQGLIVDVRGNPGGYLQAVEKIANLIVPNQKPIVQIEDRQGKRQPFYSTSNKKKNYPIVGLIDGGSASASEILAGALKQAGGYRLVGEKSFGKGTVQQGIQLSDKSELKLTTNKWLTPDGDWIHKKGVQPTIQVKQPDYFYAAPLVLKKDQVLKPDQTSSHIADAQKMLKAAGFDPKRADGYFSRETTRAVSAFQKDVSLPVTGNIDQKTAEALQAATLKAIASPKNDRQLSAAVQEVLKEIK
ncbi:S41 family peptidase [Sporolactobacillus sp. THM19-2]|uniref:S41 family peptidase n=1 Tax=Sporolactobacillus sp. THM19-2 TaxID=2511171 RepID=UPI00101E88FA|nr:S41 family peptidase [Sporolactobacillus sp. THM19-2]RYL93643.1 PDZ domain-containing protein [Sporolactobacillus sp. THM19-2]